MMMSGMSGIGMMGSVNPLGLAGAGMGGQFGAPPVFSSGGLSGMPNVTNNTGMPTGPSGLGQGTPATNQAEASKNLLVNYIPPMYDEGQVSNLFGNIGPVEKVKIIRDATGQSKGFGFVTMQNPPDALTAIKEMSGKQVAGKKLRVAYAQPHLLPGRVSPSVNVCFTGFKDKMNQQQLYNLAIQTGGQVQEAKILDPAQHPHGVGFVRYATVGQAEACVNKFNNYPFPAMDGETILLEVKYAERKKVKQKAMRASAKAGHFPSGEPSNVVFMHGIGNASELDVRQLLSPVVNPALISKIDMPKRDPTNPVKNYCFVHLNDVTTAHRVLQLNGAQGPQGKPLQVRFK